MHLMFAIFWTKIANKIVLKEFSMDKLVFKKQMQDTVFMVNTAKLGMLHDDDDGEMVKYLVKYEGRELGTYEGINGANAASAAHDEHENSLPRKKKLTFSVKLENTDTEEEVVLQFRFFKIKDSGRNFGTIQAETAEEAALKALTMISNEKRTTRSENEAKDFFESDY
jgi:hypothetical protein